MRALPLVAAGLLLLTARQVHAEPAGLVQIPGAVPAALTSAAAPAPSLAAAEAVATGSSDLDWLQGLTMPDLPVKLTDPIIEQLERIRAKGFWKRTMARWLARAGRYESHVKRILREEGVPEDLMYVAMIESGFNPSARSHAGATGMWQFMPAAGSEQGLEKNRWIDERLDFERATRGAARYLKGLNERFGSWELALAAYNMGHYGMLTSIRTYNTNDYWLLRSYEAGLPYETRNYVPRIMAAAIVGRNPERFGFGEIERVAPLQFETVLIKRSVRLAQVARVTGTALDKIRSLNPALRRGRTPRSSKGYRLRLPEGALERGGDRLRRIGAVTDDLGEHEVIVGESLAAVAKAHGVSKRQLAQLNELSTRAKLEPGTKLLVPSGKVAPPTSPAQEQGTVDVVVPAKRFVYQNRRRVFYRVIRGDTVNRIAAAFGVTSELVVLWNDLEAAGALQDDMILQLFVPTSWQGTKVRFIPEARARVFLAGSVEHYEELARRRGRERIVYRVRRGDTLRRLSKRYDLGVVMICRINQINRREDLTKGQELVLYTQPRRRARRPAAKAPAAKAPAAKAPTQVRSPAAQPQVAAPAPEPTAAPETEGGPAGRDAGPDAGPVDASAPDATTADAETTPAADASTDTAAAMDAQ